MHQFEPHKINFKYVFAAIKFVSFEEMEDLCQLNLEINLFDGLPGNW